MKKVRVFMIVSVILILASTVTFAILYHQPGMTFQTVQGDATVLNDIKVNMKVTAQRYENSAYAYLTLENEKMHTNIDKKSSIKMIDNRAVDDSVSIQIEYENAKGAKSEWERGENSKIRAVSQADMTYTIFLPTGLVVYNNQNYNPMNVTIHTGLTMYSNEDYEIIEELYNESESSNFRLQDLNDQDDIYEYTMEDKNLIIKMQDDYYFVPYRDKHIKGTNHIYRIYIKDKKAYYEELASLPEHQKELNLYTYNNKLYMLVERQGRYYFQKYDEKGKLLEELKISNKRIGKTFIHNNIMSMIDKDSCYVVDMDTMKLLDQCNLKTVEKPGIKNVSYRYEDILYKNNTIYIAVKDYGYMEETNTSYTKQKIIAIKENKELYRGLMKLENNTEVYTNYSYVDVLTELE